MQSLKFCFHYNIVVFNIYVYISLLLGIRLSRWDNSLLQNRVQYNTWTLSRKICIQVLKLPLMINAQSPKLDTSQKVDKILL